MCVSFTLPCPRLCFAVWSCLCVSDRFVRLLGRLFRIRWKSEPFFCFFFLPRCRQKNCELLLCRIVSYWLVEGKPVKKKKKIFNTKDVKRISRTHEGNKRKQFRAFSFDEFFVQWLDKFIPPKLLPGKLFEWRIHLVLSFHFSIRNVYHTHRQRFSEPLSDFQVDIVMRLYNICWVPFRQVFFFR